MAIIIMLTAVAIAGKRSVANNQENNLLAQNVEALADSPEDREYPRYINKTDKRSRKEQKVEIGKDGIKYNYSRTCTDYYTYCKHTGKEVDICYESLNGFVTSCQTWGQE